MVVVVVIVVVVDGITVVKGAKVVMGAGTVVVAEMVVVVVGTGGNHAPHRSMTPGRRAGTPGIPGPPGTTNTDVEVAAPGTSGNVSGLHRLSMSSTSASAYRSAPAGRMCR